MFNRVSLLLICVFFSVTAWASPHKVQITGHIPEQLEDYKIKFSANFVSQPYNPHKEDVDGDGHEGTVYDYDHHALAKPLIPDAQGQFSLKFFTTGSCDTSKRICHFFQGYLDFEKWDADGKNVHRARISFNGDSEDKVQSPGSVSYQINMKEKDMGYLGHVFVLTTTNADGKSVILSDEIQTGEPIPLILKEDGLQSKIDLTFNVQNEFK